MLTYEEYLQQFRTEEPTHQPYCIADGERDVLPRPGLRRQIAIDHLLILLDCADHFAESLPERAMSSVEYSQLIDLWIPIPHGVQP